MTDHSIPPPPPPLSSTATKEETLIWASDYYDLILELNQSNFNEWVRNHPNDTEGGLWLVFQDNKPEPTHRGHTLTEAMSGVNSAAFCGHMIRDREGVVHRVFAIHSTASSGDLNHKFNPLSMDKFHNDMEHMMDKNQLRFKEWVKRYRETHHDIIDQEEDRWYVFQHDRIEPISQGDTIEEALKDVKGTAYIAQLSEYVNDDHIDLAC